MREWTLNSNVCRYAEEILTEYEVKVIRSDDITGKTDINLKVRTDKINEVNADMSISVHHNANTGSWGEWTGVEVYSHARKPKRDADLAELFANEISKLTGLKNRGAKNNLDLHMVRETKQEIPSVLCEGGFMDSTIDEPVIISEKGQRAYARAISNVCISYLRLEKKEHKLNSETCHAYALLTKEQDYDKYKSKRDELIKKNEEKWFHLNFTENTDEQQAYSLMDRHRTKLINSHNNFNTVFPPMQPFYSVKNIIENDKLFKLFKLMPKGGILHLHTSATADAKWIVEQVLNKDYPNTPIYIYLKEDDPTGINANKYVDRQLIFYNKLPNNQAGFKKVKEAAQMITDFKNQMIDLLTFSSPRIEQIPYIWNEFNTIFQRTSELLKNHEFYFDYYKRAFENLIDDNIQYVELRSNIATFESTPPGGKIFLDILEDAKQAACIQKSKQLTLKIILCGNRSKNLTVESVIDKIKSAITLKNDSKYKNLIVGFDIVGEEDRGRPTEDYIQEIYSESLHDKIDFYFHDGESNWASNNNIIAAYLMSEKRVGHGFNLNRFPELIDRILESPEVEKEEKFPFAIEICPISNQLLRYFPDLRNHTAYELMKRGIQCVIASDDPQIFENHGLSYDFWETFVGFGVNLMAIKKLVFNSINYSAMSIEEKISMRTAVGLEWMNFVQQVIAVLGKEISIDNVSVNKMAKVTINKRICHTQPLKNEKKSVNSIEYITIHSTNNYKLTANARAYAEYLYSGEKGIPADFHYIVDKDEIWQAFEDTQICNHCDGGFNGDGNTASIGVAICVNDKKGFSKACLNSAHLVAKLLKEHNISIKNVVPHHHWSSTDCPNELRNGIWNITWDNFIEMVKNCIKEAETL